MAFPGLVCDFMVTSIPTLLVIARALYHINENKFIGPRSTGAPSSRPIQDQLRTLPEISPHKKPTQNPAFAGSGVGLEWYFYRIETGAQKRT